MKKAAQALCIMLSLVCAGCNGTNDAAPSGGPPVSSPPAPPPAPPQNVGCNTLSFARTSDIDALPGGIWSGWLVDCSDHPQSSFVQAMVTEDGRFHIVVGDGRLLTGTLGTGGNLVDGHGIDYARDGFEYFSGPTTGLFVQGTVVERQKLQGRWGTEWGGYGYFDLDYLQEAYERPTPLADLAGAWPLYSNHTGIPVEGVWTVEADGRFDGQDGAGCLYSGQFSLIDERFSIVAVDISLSGCSRAGTYTGLAYREDLVDWYEKGIVISVDNGKQALHLSLAIERP